MGDHVSFVPETGALLLRSVSFRDSGDYLCLVNNKRENGQVRLMVQGKKKFFLRKIIFILSSVIIIIIKIEKNEEFDEISKLIKSNLSTTEVIQTSTPANNTNEQVQHNEVVEVPATQSSRGTSTYTPPRVQNNPTTNASPQVAPNNTETSTVLSPSEPSTSETTGTSE